MRMLNHKTSRTSLAPQNVVTFCQVGVHLSRDLMAIAGGSLKANITTLGPLVLPYSEQLLFFFNLCVNLFVQKVQRTMD